MGTNLSLVDKTECSDGVTLLFQLRDADVDLPAGEVVDVQTIDDLVAAPGCGARERADETSRIL